jgi:hypothetical protein
MGQMAIEKTEGCRMDRGPSREQRAIEGKRVLEETEGRRENRGCRVNRWP